MTRLAAAGGLLLLAATASARLPLPPVPKLDAHGHPLPPGAVARLGDWGRRFSPAHAFSFSPDGRVLARSRPTGIDFRDVRTDRDVTPAWVRGLAGAVTFTPTGDLFQSDHQTGTHRLLRGDTGAVVFDLSAKGRYVRDIQFLPGRVRLVAVVQDPSTPEQVRVFDPADADHPAGRTVCETGGCGRCAVTPDGRWVAVAVDHGRVNVHDAATGKLLHHYKGEDNGTGGHPLVALPDGKTVLVGEPSGLVPLTLTDKEVKAGERLPVGGAYDLRLAADGTAVFAVRHGSARRVEWPSGGVTDLVTPPPGWRCCPGVPILSPDGRAAVDQAEGELPRVTDTATGRPLVRYDGLVPVVTASPQGAGRVVVADRAGVREYAVPGGAVRVARPLPPVEHGDQSRTVSADGRLSVHRGGVGGRADQLFVRDVETGREVWRRGFESSDAGFTPDGRSVVAVGQGHVEVYDAAAGGFRFRVDRGEQATVAGSPDGRLVAVGRAPPIRVVEAATGAVRVTIGRPAATVNGVVASRLRFSADNRFLAGFGWSYGAVVWDLADGSMAYSAGDAVPDNGFAVGDISPDGRWLAHAHRFDHKVRVWDWAAPRGSARDVWLAGHEGDITDAAFTPDGKYLLTGGQDGTVLVWDVARIATRSRVAPDRADPDDLLSGLGNADAEAAGKAVAALVRRPAEAVAAARRHLPPAVAPDSARLAALVADLAADDARARDRAEADLVGLADLAGEVLRVASRSAVPERRRRAERLLARLDGPVTDPARLQVLRAVEVVERVGSPEARELLGAWAAGAGPALLTREATAALARLAGR